MSNLREFVKLTTRNNGASYNLSHGIINPQDGYMVSRPHGEAKVPIEHLATHLPTYIQTRAEFIEDYEKNSGKLVFIGSWISEDEPDTVYLDMSIKVDDLENAVYMGIMNNQQAIWDCKRQRVITLPKPQTTGTSYQCKAYARQAAEKLTNQYYAQIKSEIAGQDQ